jgi:hypothetical protein
MLPAGGVISLSNEGRFIPAYAEKANSFADNIQSQRQPDHKRNNESHSDDSGAGLELFRC